MTRETKTVLRSGEQEFLWRYHPDPPYDQGTWSWGFDGATAGPTFHSRYGSPALVRIVNELPPVGASRATFALPSTTTHLHNFHSASESDGGPEDWIDSGEFWDHHYCNFPSGHDPREKLTTLWYHDHRMDFTAANVYAGLSGFHLYFDEQDTGDENDPSPEAWRLPSWYLEKSTLTSYRWATLMNSSRARTGRRSGWAAPGAGSPSAAPTGC